MPRQVVVQCIQATLECARACDAFVSVPLAETEKGRTARAVNLAMDCSDLCYELVRLIQRDSEMLKPQCRLLAEACELCAEECRNLDCESIPFLACAQACEICSQACLKVSGSLVEAGS
jgi:hypothetical protein